MNDTQRRQELAHFLRTRRSPEAAGVSVGSRRRTPGLRREELSQLAGVGLTWYTRLEQGKDIIVSPQVLESLAGVFDLNAAERQYLFVLAREEVPADPHSFTNWVTPQLQGVLEAISTPAYVINPRWDIVGWNQAMRRVFSDFEGVSMLERNIPRSLFTNPLLRTMLYDWEKEARGILALFRASTGRYVREPWFKALAAELEQTSPEFREWWSQRDIQSVYMGLKELKHPLLGPLAFQTNTFQIVDVPDLRMIIFTAAEVETARKLMCLTEPMEAQRIG